MVTNGNDAERLLNDWAWVDATTIDDETPLYSACRRGLLDVIETLLRYGADPNRQSTKVPLYAACRTGDVRIVRALLSNGADPNHLPSRSESESEVCPFTDEHSDKDETPVYGKRPRLVFGDHTEREVSSSSAVGNSGECLTVLCTMCAEGNLPMIDVLLEHGTNVNIVSLNGKTPLHCVLDHLINENKCPIYVMRPSNCNQHASLTSHFWYDGCCDEEEGLKLLEFLIDAVRNESGTSYPVTPAGRQCCNQQHDTLATVIAITNKLIKRGADVNLRDSTGRTVLHRAIDAVCDIKMLNGTRALCSELVTVLLDSGTCDVNSVSDDKSSALYSACAAENTKMVSRLLRLGAREIGNPSLMVACEREYLDVVQLLLRYGSDPNSRLGLLNSDESCRSHKSDAPLCIAAYSGHAPIVRLLLRHGANANIKDCLDMSPVMHIISRDSTLIPADGDVHDHDAVISELVDHGLDATCALEQLQKWSNWSYDKFKLLLKCGADPNGVVSDCPILFLAVNNNKKKIVRVLLEHNANPNILCEIKEFRRSRKYQTTPLCLAAERKHIGMVRVLLLGKVELNMRDGRGMAALHYACRNDTPEIAKELLKAGADLDLFTEPRAVVKNRSPFRLSPLLIATGKGHVEIVDILLKNRVNVNACNDLGRTALHFVVEHAYICYCKICKGPEHRENDLGGKSPSRRAYHRCSSDSSDYRSDDSDSDSDTCSPSRRSGFNKHRAVLAKLLNGGADVNAVDVKGKTALYMATKNSITDFVRLMLDVRGVNPNQTASGRYPLNAACTEPQPFMEIIIMLLDAGADPNLMTPVEVTYGDDMVGPNARLPLGKAANFGNVPLMRMLIDKGAHVTAEDSEGRDALSYLLFSEGFEINDEVMSITKFLLDNGANLNKRLCSGDEDEEGELPLGHILYSVGYNNDEVHGFIKLLVNQYGSRLDDFIMSKSILHTSENWEAPIFSLKRCMASSMFLEKHVFWLFKAGAGRLPLLAYCEAEDCNQSRIDKANSMDTRLCMALILNGYCASEADLEYFRCADVTGLSPTSAKSFSKFVRWITEDVKQPPSLMRQCRVSSRRWLSVLSEHQTILPFVEILPLPSELLSYLKYEGPLCEVDLTESKSCEPGQ